MDNTYIHRGDVVRGEVITDHFDIVVTGSVRGGGMVVASGGGATVVVMGDVYEGAQIGAQGGGAKVVVLGNVRRN